MAKLYVITGPAGVGKSTVSRKIAESFGKSALIEGDDLYAQIIGGYVNPWEEMIRNEFSNCEIRFVVLLVDEETILARDKIRPAEFQMKERCIILLNEFKEHIHTVVNC